MEPSQLSHEFCVRFSLQSQLASLGTEQVEPTTMAEFRWRDISFPVRSPSVQSALAEAAAAVKQLSEAAGAGEESRLALLDRVANAYAGVRSAIQSALVNGEPYGTLWLSSGSLIASSSL